MFEKNAPAAKKDGEKCAVIRHGPILPSAHGPWPPLFVSASESRPRSLIVMTFCTTFTTSPPSCSFPDASWFPARKPGWCDPGLTGVRDEDCSPEMPSQTCSARGMLFHWPAPAPPSQRTGEVEDETPAKDHCERESERPSVPSYQSRCSASRCEKLTRTPVRPCSGCCKK
jgi:hypothetical protein